MLIKKSVVVCLLLISLLVSVVCPCLISCSDSAATDITMPRDYQNDDSLRDTTDVPEYYVGNLASKVFHRPDCNRVPLMNPANKVTLRGTRDTAIACGYTPCGICTP